MKSRMVRKCLMTIALALVMVLGGSVAVPEKASAAVTDTVLRWPTKNTKLSQSFSATSSKVHQGVDIPGTLNDEIYAAEAGTVVSRGNISGGYGNYLVIKHQNGLFTLYGHLNKYASNVEVNKNVAKGQTIAYMGNTGYSTGVHLHFEVRKVKTLYYDSQLSEIQKNLYNPMSFKYTYGGDTSTIANSNIAKIPSTITQGNAWTCDGTVSSNYNIKYVNGYIITNTGKKDKWNDETKVYSSFNSNIGSKTYNLKNSKTDRELLFDKLSPGNYYYIITARDTTDAPLQVVQNFTVVAKQPTNNQPIGVVDSIVCDEYGKIHVKGWAYDPDSKGSALDIHVYVGGASSPNVPCTVIKANVKREDVNKSKGCGEYHGFDAQISTNRTGNVPVYIYAIDTAGGHNPLLGNKTVTVETATPIGVFEKVESVSSNKIHVVGWAYDPDTKDKAVTVAVYIGGQCNVAGVESHQITADITREDINKSKNCGTKHGFDAVITTQKTGVQAIYVWAHNTDGSPSNINTFLGNKEVNIHNCNAVIDPAVAPTYEATGLTEGSHCSVCGKVIVAQEVVPKLLDESFNNDQENNNYYDEKEYTDIEKQKLVDESATTDKKVISPINVPDNNSSIDKQVSKENDNNIETGSKGSTDSKPSTTNTVSNEQSNNDTSNDDESDDEFVIGNISYEIISGNRVMITSIENHKVQSVNVPDTVIYNKKKYKVVCIFDEAFMNCSSLKKIEIGKNVEEIGDSAFKNCSNLKSITIKTTKLTKKSIGKNAFKGISKKATFKFSKKQFKNYKKWIKKAGAPKIAKFKKQ